ncbi:MAG: hypothetical protein OEV66_07015 [Spirochaetia bacterium]|nr:hypothetical protein [Spirochaetia bacterium]
MNLANHLSILDHSRLADLIGDATIVELINEISKTKNLKVDRGELILDCIGGPHQILENIKYLQKLLIGLPPIK